MQAIILVAGYATRLSPLTDNMPKALLPIGGKPILDYLVDNIKRVEAVERIIIISNDKFFDMFSDWAANRGDLNVTVLNDGTRGEHEKLGAIGDIQFAIREMNVEGDCLIAAGDNLICEDLREVYRRFEQLGDKTLILAQKTQDTTQLKRFAVATADENGRVLSLIEKPEYPQGDLAVFAVYLYPERVMQMLPEYLESGRSYDAPGHFPQWLSEREDIYIYPTDKPCFDIGTLETLKNVRERAGKENFNVG